MIFSLATVTTSLKGLFWSLGLGGIVLGLIVGGLLFLSQNDQITRS